jgi:large conductance mechanosensitive channel
VSPSRRPYNSHDLGRRLTSLTTGGGSMMTTSPSIARMPPGFANSGGQKEGNMLKEFRDFAMRGNLVDMAVGIIMGTAFGGLVNSMVNDIIMPIVGRITGGVDFSNYFFNLSSQEYPSLKAAKDAGAATVNYGLFINLIINFVIVAFVMFMLIKAMNKTRKEAPAAPSPPPPRSETLLEEIRDLLKKPA